MKEHQERCCCVVVLHKILCRVLILMQKLRRGYDAHLATLTFLRAIFRGKRFTRKTFYVSPRQHLWLYTTQPQLSIPSKHRAEGCRNFALPLWSHPCTGRWTLYGELGWLISATQVFTTFCWSKSEEPCSTPSDFSTELIWKDALIQLHGLNFQLCDS